MLQKGLVQILPNFWLSLPAQTFHCSWRQKFRENTSRDVLESSWKQQLLLLSLFFYVLIAIVTWVSVWMPKDSMPDLVLRNWKIFSIKPFFSPMIFSVQAAILELCIKLKLTESWTLSVRRNKITNLSRHLVLAFGTWLKKKNQNKKKH